MRRRVGGGALPASLLPESMRPGCPFDLVLQRPRATVGRPKHVPKTCPQNVVSAGGTKALRHPSCSPSRPRSANRTRHLLTVLALQPSPAAISLLDRPSAAAKTAGHQNASACELFGRRAHLSSTSRCSLSSTISVSCAISGLQSSPIRTTFRRRTAGPCGLATRDTSSWPASVPRLAAPPRTGQARGDRAVLVRARPCAVRAHRPRRLTDPESEPA